MSQSTDKQLFCIIFSILFSYANHYACIHFVYNYIIQADLYQNPQYIPTNTTKTEQEYTSTQDIYILLIILLCINCRLCWFFIVNI